jgi:hypothetical protein
MTTGGKLLLAPIDSNVQHVLDIGTGVLLLSCYDILPS